MAVAGKAGSYKRHPARPPVGAGLAGDHGGGRIIGIRFHANASAMAVAGKAGSYKRHPARPPVGAGLAGDHAGGRIIGIRFPADASAMAVAGKTGSYNDAASSCGQPSASQVIGSTFNLGRPPSSTS